MNKAKAQYYRIGNAQWNVNEIGGNLLVAEVIGLAEGGRVRRCQTATHQ